MDKNIMEINEKESIDKLINILPIGSIEYQIIKLTKRINKLQKHFNKNPHDFHNKISLLKIISRRKKFINYIKRKDLDIYKRLIDELNIRK